MTKVAHRIYDKRCANFNLPISFCINLSPFNGLLNGDYLIPLRVACRLSSELINQVVVVARIAVDGAGRTASNQRQVGNGQIGGAAGDAVGVLIVKHPAAHLRRFARQYQVAARLAFRRPCAAAEVSRDFRHARAFPVQDGVQPLQDVHFQSFPYLSI